MIRNILIALTIGLSATMAAAAGGSNVYLDHMKPDMKNTESLQEGLRTFMDFCAGCHSMEYARYNRVARDLDIPEDVFMENIVFSDDVRFGDLMTIAMDKSDGKAWFGATPPDLTMVTRVRGVDWVYTYLRSFYKDDSRPYGVNNSVYPKVGMPHVMLELQGLCAHPASSESHGGVDPLTGNEIHDGSCSNYAVEGELDEHEFDKVVYDLVNFLNYMGEPYQNDRKSLGWKVFAFLSVLLVLSILLQRELFKDIKH